MLDPIVDFLNKLGIAAPGRAGDRERLHQKGRMPFGRGLETAASASRFLRFLRARS